MNLSKNVPQRVVSLEKEWEFVHFVSHTLMSEKKIFDERREKNCNIMFLAKHRGEREETRLMCLRSDPWTISETDDGQQD